MLKESLKNILEGTSPRFLSDNLEYYEDHMKTFANRMDKIIDDILFQIDFSEVLCFGFSMKMDCWIVSSIIARKIKEIDSEMPVVIGGVSTKKDAEAFLSSFPQFDLAMWGEEETPILQVVEALENNEKDFSNICNIAYRDPESNIIFSKKPNRNFMDLSIEGVFILIMVITSCRKES